MQPTHVVIVGLDGLRADMMTPDTTPHLLRLAQQGVWFSRHHAVFPTATRVNVTSLVTGTNSGTHGIVNNSIFEPGWRLIRWSIAASTRWSRLPTHFTGERLGLRAWEKSSRHMARPWWR